MFSSSSSIIEFSSAFSIAIFEKEEMQIEEL